MSCASGARSGRASSNSMLKALSATLPNTSRPICGGCCRRVPPAWDPSVPAISEFDNLVRGSNEFEFVDLVAIDNRASNGRVPTRFPRIIRVARGVVVAFYDIDGKEVHALVVGLHNDRITVRGFDGKRLCPS